MSQGVKSVPGIRCLYQYQCKSGENHYFVKVQHESRILRQKLKVPENCSLKQLKKVAESTIYQLKNGISNPRSFMSYVHEYIVVHQLAPKTAKAYHKILSKYSFDGLHNAEELQRTLQSGVNSCQIAHTVKAFFNWLIMNHVDVINPAANIKMPRAKTRSRTLTQDEISKFYEELCRHSKELELMGRLLLETGARVSTICGIHIQDIRDHYLYLHNFKCHREYRLPVPLSSETIKICRALCSTNDRTQMLFRNKASALVRELRKLLDQLFNRNPGQERIVIHSLRHTAATMALQNNVPLEIVSRMLDHINLDTTFKIYANLNQKQLNAGFDALFKAYQRCCDRQ